MIPLATTTVTVSRQTEAEPGEGITATTVATHVRAAIVGPTGSEQPAPGGGAERVDAVLDSDPIDGLDHLCTVTDDDGNTWDVAWVQQRTGFGLSHTRAGLVRARGRVAA